MLTLYVLIAVPVVLIFLIRIFGAKARVYARNSQERVADVVLYWWKVYMRSKRVQAYTHEPIEKHVFFSRIDGVMEAARTHEPNFVPWWLRVLWASVY